MPQLTPHAKAILSAVIAVVVAGITAYQSVAAGGFRLIDLVPVTVAVAAALQTRLIPNLGLAWAKAAINGFAAVIGAVATVVAADPTGVTVAKIATVAVGAFLVWFVPEAGPDVAEVVADATSQPVAVKVSANVGQLSVGQLSAGLADAVQELSSMQRSDEPPAVAPAATIPPA